MLMIERTIRHICGQKIGDEKMPGKGKVLMVVNPNPLPTLGIWWTERKSPEGKRLFNVGDVRPDGGQPPLFQY